MRDMATHFYCGINAILRTLVKETFPYTIRANAFVGIFFVYWERYAHDGEATAKERQRGYYDDLNLHLPSSSSLSMIACQICFVDGSNALSLCATAQFTTALCRASARSARLLAL